MSDTQAGSATIAVSDRLPLFFLALYALGRLLQLVSAEVPILFTVIFHVVPPALFALVHGARTFGLRGIVLFTVICLGCASFFESLSLRTGFPFGHYVFTGVMGPKLFQLPVLLALAYLGIGYCAWILARVILVQVSERLSVLQLFITPLLASAIFLA
jgi:putative membrane protein